MRRAAATWLTLWIGAAVALRLLAPDSGADHVLDRALLRPSLGHPFGFDAFGRELIATVLRASFTSVAFSAGAVAISTASALLLGASISLAPPLLRSLGLRVLESLLAFPSLLFALAFAAVRGPSWTTLSFALLIGILPGFTRLVEVRSRELLQEDYVLAARSLGAGDREIIRRHLLPALFSLARVKIPNLFSHALLAEATLSFLGIGAPVGRDTWGSLLAQGKDYLFESPHIALGAGFPLVLTVLSLQLLTEKRLQKSGFDL